MKIESIAGLEGITEDRLWELVELAHWPCDYEKASIMYRKLLSKEDCLKFRKAVNKAYNLLDKTISADPINDELGCGDDGYSDLINHIIGLGRKEYYRYLNNLCLVKRLANTYGYKESYSYCIPYEDDYKKDSKYSIDNVIKIAEGSLSEIKKFRKLDNPTAPWLSPINNDILTIEKTFAEFLKDPNINLNYLIKNKKIVEACSNRIEKFFDVNKMELPRKFTENGHNGICTPLFDNTVSDAETLREYME